MNDNPSTISERRFSNSVEIRRKKFDLNKKLSERVVHPAGIQSGASLSKACAMVRAGPVMVAGSTLCVTGLMPSCIAAAIV